MIKPKANASTPTPRPGAHFDPATGQPLPRPPKPGPGIVLRLLGMLLILLPLWIAASMVNSLISEREGVRESAESEISEKWGNDQVLAGPVMVLPWIQTEQLLSHDNGKTVYRTVRHRRSASFLPERLEIKGILRPEIRRRGIFETVLYIAELDVKGSFKAPDLRGLEIDPATVLWDKAVLSASVSDLRGIRDGAVLDWGGRNVSFEPGAGESSPFGFGFHARDLRLGQAGKGEVPFSFKLSLNGSRTLKVLPLGRQNSIALESTWPDPSFNGEYLPVEREVGPNGFKARWSVHELARSFPQSWRNNDVDGSRLSGAAFGLGLVRTASTYQQSARATKYAVLFLLLTFTFFFLFEVLGKAKVHPVQYLLVGAALVVFYLLLLSVSEQLGFNAAYGLASIATLGLIWAYVRAILKEPGRARLLLASLAGLYAYLFVILRLDDYALLMGSLGVFAALATLMLLTRKIDWYNLDKEEPR